MKRKRHSRMKQKRAPKQRVMRRRTRVARHAVILNKALIAGRMVANDQHMIQSKHPIMSLNWLWNQWFIASKRKIFPWQSYCELARHYVQGYCEQSGLQGHDWMLIPTNKKVGAIVTVMNEEETLPSVLGQLNRLPLHEMIVIVNGSTDRSLHVTREYSKAIIVHYSEPLGHDIGRAIGAKLSQSDMLLFLDGDFPVFAEHLLPFIYAVESGHDVVLNDISPYMQSFKYRDAVTIIKDFVNRSLGREDLKANSMSAVPHALSKRAVETIGYETLAVPPKAQAKAIASGLSITSPASIDVISANRQRRRLNIGKRNPVANMIIGDHIEALATLMNAHGARLSFTDHIRDRALMRRKQQ